MTAFDAPAASWDLPEGYPRHAPTRDEQRRALWHLAGRAAWADLDWLALVDALLRLGRTDVPLSRLVEGHVDALRILREAGQDAEPGAVYGVWASRSRASGLSARPTSEGWVLDGALEFASGAGVIDRALVPVWPDDGGDSMLLDLPVDGWDFDSSRWRTRAMELSRTHRTELVARRATGAREIGDGGWYLARPGFFPGGVGVAAVWAGGAARVADLLRLAVPPERRTAAQQQRLGRVRADVAVASAICRDAAGHLGSAEPGDLRLISTLARGGVAAAVRRVLDEARTLAGPVGLTQDVDLTRGIDDLALYVAQHNADADAVQLGESP